MRSTLLLIAGAVLTLGLTACGGDDLDSPPPIATTPVPAPEVVELDLLDGSFDWTHEPDSITFQAVNGGYMIAPNDSGQQLRAIVPGDTVVQGATVEMDFEFDQAFIDSGANFQVIVQQNGGGFQGVFRCWVGADVIAASGGSHSLDSCTVNGDELDLPGVDEGWRVGIQTEKGEGVTVAGTITIVRAVFIPVVPLVPGDPIALDLTASGGWEVEGAISGPEFSDAGVSYGAGDFTQFGSQLRTVRAGPDDLNSTRIQATVEVDDAFLATGLQLQAVIQLNQSPFSGYFDCNFDNADLDTGTASVDCTSSETGLSVGEAEGLRVGVNAYGNFELGTPPGENTGTVTITEFILTPPAP